MSQDEALEYIDRQNAIWWNSMFPGEPVPVVEVRGYLDPLDTGSEVNDCIQAANLPGVTVGDDGGVVFGDMNSTDTRAFNRVQWECSAAYPYDVSDPESLGLYSDEQLTYLAHYFLNDLAPCLRLMGYRVEAQPSVRFIVDNGPYPQWVPYYVMKPQPTTNAEWERVDFRCPPPAIGEFYRPGLDYQI